MKKDKNIYGREGKKNPFRVPDSYFEDFPRQLKELCVEEEKKEQPFFSFSNVFTFRFIAPALMIIVLVYVSINHFFIHDHNEQLPKEQIESYLSDEINLDEQMLIETLGESEQENITKARTDSSGQEEQVIINYLIENNIDENTIYSEL